MATDKTPGLAALLSFIFSGLGEIYAGKPLRGIPLMLADVILIYFTFRDVGARPPLINFTPLFLSLFVTAGSMVNAYFCAKQFNAQHFTICPRCGGKNAKGAPQCLLCWAPLAAAGAPVAYGPVPPPPPPR